MAFVPYRELGGPNDSSFDLDELVAGLRARREAQEAVDAFHAAGGLQGDSYPNEPERLAA